ncbi:MAG: TolC family protein [Chlorobiaceae bacterium]
MKNKVMRTASLATAALFLAWQALAGAAETPLTLEQTIHLVRQNNPALKAAAEELRAADARVTKSRSAWFPQITATAGYTYLDPVSEVPAFGKFMPNNNYEAKVTARTTLFDFAKRGNTVELALIGKKSAGNSLELSHRELSFQTVQLFYGILLLRESIKVEEKEIAALAKALDFTAKRYQAGAATRFDLLSTEVRISAAKNRMLDLAHALRRSELTLRRLAGIPESTPLDLQGSFSVKPSATADGSLVDRALQERLEMKLSRDQEAAARERRSIAFKEGLPVVTAGASWGTTNGMMPDITLMRTNFAGSLHLEVPLFTGFRNSAEQQEAKALLSAAEDRRIDLEQQSRADVEEALHARLTASSKIAATDLQVKQAALAADHARTRYSNGMATTLDLLSTETSLSQAELSRLQASYELVMSDYMLKRLTGEVFWEDPRER